MKKNGYKVKTDWNLFGKHCGFHIVKRLDWINGKPMVWVSFLNLFLIIVNFLFEKYGMDIPEISAVCSSWGWSLFNLLAKVSFWILFVDGVIVNFLWSYTRGNYECSYFAMLVKYPNLDNKAIVKETLSWARFLHSHPEFDYRLQELKNRINEYSMQIDLLDDKTGEKNVAVQKMYDEGFNSLVKEFGVNKDEKGRYFSWNDKKYQKLLKQL